jgi:hypothetical protein
MKKLVLSALLIISNILSAATVDVTVKIDEISKQTVFNCPITPLKNNNKFVCACEQFALTAKIIETFDDGLTIEFEFVDKDNEVVSRPVFRLVWGELARLTCDSCEQAFFELTVIATK